MNNHLDDASLTAYALDEIDDAQRAIVEAALEANPDARQAVEAFKAAAQLATEAYHQEPKPALTGDQRQSLLAQAASREPVGSSREKSIIERKPRWRRWTWRISAMAAAGLILIIGIAALLTGSLGARGKRAQEVNLGLAYTEAPSAEGLLREQREGLNVRADFTDDPLAFRELSLGVGAGGTAGSTAGYVGGGGMGGEAGDKIASSVAASPQIDAAVKVESATVPEGQPPDRYLIRNASLELEAQDAEAASQQLQETVRAAGGYVSGLDKRVDGLGRPSVNLTLRVPADKLDGSLDTIRTLGRIIHEQVTTEDVTEEYVDLDARLRNLKKAEERLLEHLSKAILIDSTLKVEQELTRVREQIERFEGRFRFLGHRVRYSTIQIVISQKPKAEQMAPVATFSSGRVFTQAVRSLAEFGQTLWTKTIWLLVWAPVWAIGVAVLTIVYRRIRRRVRTRR